MGIAIALLVLCCTLGGALFGRWLRSVLPEHHLSPESTHAVNLAMGLIATITALVLGLVVASAKASFDEEDASLKRMAADILTLDRLLDRYGEETQPIRGAIREALAERIESGRRVGSVGGRLPGSAGTPSIDRLFSELQTLEPRTDGQRWLQGKALDLSADMLSTRWLMLERAGSSIPAAFLIVLGFWLTLIFLSFGLVAPSNQTVSGVLLLCALSVSAAMFLILEMDQPFGGVIHISEEPILYAFERLGR